MKVASVFREGEQTEWHYLICNCGSFDGENNKFTAIQKTESEDNYQRHYCLRQR